MKNCVQDALDVLEGIRSRLPDLEFSQLGDLKVHLRFLTTFYMCGKKWGNGDRCEFVLLRIEEGIQEHVEKFQSSDLMLDQARKGVSEFLHYIRQSILQEMEKLYRIFSADGTSQTGLSFPRQVLPIVEEVLQIKDIIDSLLHNLRDLLKDNEFGKKSTGLIEDFEKYVRFLKNFILFVTWRGLERNDKMEGLLTHIGSFVLNAARLTLLFWLNQHRKIWHNLYQLTETIKPVDHHVYKIYVGILQEALASSQSRDLTISGDLIFRGFVDSLLFLLWQLIYLGGSFEGKFEHQVQKLYEELTILRRDHFFEKVQDHPTGSMICEVGLLIFHLFHKENEKVLVGKFTDLEKMFNKIIRAEREAPKYTLNPASSFPRTNLPGFIDFVLEKIALLGQTYKADSVAALPEDKFQTLHDDLVSLKSSLVDLTEQHDLDSELKTLQFRIAAVAYEIEFFLDSFVAGHVLQNPVILLSTITDEINLIKTEALHTSQIKKQIIRVARTSEKMPSAVGTGKITRVATTGKMPSAGGTLESNGLLVGFDTDAQVVIERLIGGTRLRDIVNIVGMGGVGKTTLAQRVYSDDAIARHFHVRAWCSVTQLWSKRKLLLEILNNVWQLKAADMDTGVLAEMVRRYLKGRRYLIVLDDVWDTTAWNSLILSFPNDRNGSRVLVTTRSEDVAHQLQPDSMPHLISPLNYEESYELMKTKIGSENWPPELRELGFRIVKLCKGLPLAIIIVAQLLSNRMEYDAWKKIEESLQQGNNSFADKAFETLDLAYSYLPDYLKPCFLYLGAFNEDQQIPVRELLWIWIAEGLITKTSEGDSLEEIAEGYLMELIQRSLVMVSENGSRGNVRSCVVPDLMLEFCKSNCEKEHFIHLLNGYGGKLDTSIEPSMLYRLCVNSERAEDFAESRLIYPRLRGLFFLTDYERRNERHEYDIWNLIFQARLLRALDARRVTVIGTLFPRVIESLVLLRYLAVSVAAEGTKLTIPSSIGDLRFLETFLIQVNQPVGALLPYTVWSMKRLRHMRITGAFARWVFPEENLEDYPSLENLETLSTAEFSSHDAMNGIIRKFPNICRLKCNLNMIKGASKRVSIDVMSRLLSLHISCYHHAFLSSSGSGTLDLSLPPGLKKLTLSNLVLSSAWITSTVGKLPSLQVLKLLDVSFEGDAWEMEAGDFRKLRFLKLAALELVNWRGDDDQFGCLEKLVLDGCTFLEEMPSGLEFFSTLQIIEVSFCSETVEECVKLIEERQQDYGNSDFSVIIRRRD